MPGSTGKGAGVFADVAKAGGIDSSGPYTGESYDAAALIILAMQALSLIHISEPTRPY